MAVINYTPDNTKIIHNTRVDFSLRKAVPSIHIVQYDTSLPIVKVDLYLGGQPYVIPATADLRVRVGKKDKTYVYKDVLGCTLDRKSVYFEIDDQMTIFFGDINPILDLIIKSGEVTRKAGSSPIYITIDRNPVQHDYTPSNPNDYPANESAEKARDEAIAAKDAAVVARTGSETARNESLAAKVAAEAARDISVTAKNESVSAKTAAETARNAAMASQTAAKTSETNSKTSENAAKSAQTAAELAKTQAEALRAGITQDKADSAASAAAALISQNAAKTSETNSKASETAANTSKNAAKTSETNAGNSASTASTKASEASASAAAALISQNAAKTSELNVKASELELDNKFNTKVDKVTGKELSTNDYTTAEKNKLAGIATGAEVNVQSDWNITNTANDAFIKNKPKTVVATPEMTEKVGLNANNELVVKPIGSGGGGGYEPDEISIILNEDDKLSLNTEMIDGKLSGYVLKDGSKVLSDNNYTTTEKNKLAGITSGAQVNPYSKTELDNKFNTKVDKVTGKVLSTNDFTTTLKGKLDGIQTGAEVNVQSDWNITDTTNDAFIKNKPTIPAALSKATKAEAEAGTNDTKYMTPLRTKDAIANTGVTLTDAQTISGVKTFSNQIRRTNVGYDTGLLIEGTGASLGTVPNMIRSEILKARAINSNNNITTMFTIGWYGREEFGGVPQPYYMYLDSRSNGTYDNATLKVDANDRVAVATGYSRPTEALDVGGKIRMRTQTVAGDDDDIVVTKGYMDASIRTLNYDIVLIADTAFTISQAHFNKTLIITSSTDVTITVPTKIVESIEKGFFCDIVRYGTGEVSFSGAGIVLNSAGPLSIDAQYIAASLIKIDGNNEWLLIGGRE